MSAAVLAAPVAEDVFLAAYLAPLRPFFDRPEVCEVLVNRPGEVWIETAGASSMHRCEVPAVDDRLLRRLAEQIARVTCQGITREQPLLSATLPDGARVQIVGPPATRAGWALAIRRQRIAEVPLEAWRPRLGQGRGAPVIDDAALADPLGWLATQVRARRTVLVAGGTSSGKTTFLNALLRAVGPDERIVAIEDAPELHLRQPNALGLVAVKGALGEARVTTEDLLQASLRLRPDRLILGELRGSEAVTFLRAVNTGHPGSLSTVHANSCRGALDQLALMAMQAGLGLSRGETLRYAASVVDVVVQLERQGGERSLVDIRCAADLVD